MWQDLVGHGKSVVNCVGGRCGRTNQSGYTAYVGVYIDSILIYLDSAKQNLTNLSLGIPLPVFDTCGHINITSGRECETVGGKFFVNPLIPYLNHLSDII
jgi:hypothetical protein